MADQKDGRSRKQPLSREKAAKGGEHSHVALRPKSPTPEISLR
jgi:hypothetical protein